MIEIQSMTQATIFICIAVFFILLFVLRANPLQTAGQFVQELFTSRKYVLHFVAMLAILFFNKVELTIEKQMKNQVDFTPSFFRLEGDLTYWIQHSLRNDLLTTFTTFYYIVIFTALLIASIGIYTHTKKYHLFYALCYAVMINYMVAIPFYFFFPVTEVWAFHPKVDFLIPEVFPTFEQEYRPLSGLDNCFPSLHTSLSMTIALIAARSGIKSWRWFTAISAGIIIFAIFYLGIHWVIDSAGGVLLAIVASQIGLRVAEGRREFSPHPAKPNKWNKRDLNV